MTDPRGAEEAPGPRLCMKPHASLETDKEGEGDRVWWFARVASVQRNGPPLLSRALRSSDAAPAPGIAAAFPLLLRCSGSLINIPRTPVRMRTAFLN